MGNRPSFPDSLPAIGKAARHRNLFYCFGHEKLGLTQAAISAQAMATLVAGGTAPVDLSPFALERFL
jgi:D-amino-acid dehydrogenase